MTSTCVVLLDTQGTDLTLPAISSPVSIFQQCLNFTGNSLSRGGGPIKVICLMHLWEPVLVLNTAAATFIPTQEEEKEKEKEVVAMSSSSAVFYHAGV